MTLKYNLKYQSAEETRAEWKAHAMELLKEL